MTWFVNKGLRHFTDFETEFTPYHRGPQQHSHLPSLHFDTQFAHAHLAHLCAQLAPAHPASVADIGKQSRQDCFRVAFEIALTSGLEAFS